MSRYYLGIDQGTTGTTALILDDNWTVVGKGYKKHRQIYPQPGWVEHDPEEIFDAVLAVSREAAAKAGITMSQITAMGLDHQGETCTMWNIRTGEPIYNAIVWQDKRTAQFCDILGKDHGEEIRRLTGLVPDAYFSGSKLRWILQNAGGAREAYEAGELRAGTLETYLLWRLSGGEIFVTDPSSAGRTLLMDINKATWDHRMLEYFEIPAEILPPIQETCCQKGFTDPETFGAKIPICASIVDGPAALFAHGCVEPGNIKVSYGTGVFTNFTVGNEPVISEKGLITGLPWRINGENFYSLVGSAYIAGSGLEWMCNNLNLLEHASQSEAMACSVPDTAGVYLVPAFSGISAPWWDQYARGLIIGLTGMVRKEHLVRAMLESIAFQTCDIINAIQQETAIPIQSVRVDGGMVENKFLMQMQTDLINIPIDVPAEKEMTAYGAALMSAYAMGEFSQLSDVKKCVAIKNHYEPRMSEDERLEKIHQWHRAVERSLHWVEA